MSIPIVYTGGSFDLPHHGHYRLLERAAQFGKVVVSLNLDEFYEKYKGKKFVLSYDERREILLACKWVHDVVPNVGGADSKIAIDIVKPDYIVIGSDWATKDYHAQMGFTQEWLDERGIGMIYLPYTKGVSSTDIKKRMEQRNGTKESI
jgi:glycerol-3-phosphate cytidylyltransferase